MKISRKTSASTTSWSTNRECLLINNSEFQELDRIGLMIYSHWGSQMRHLCFIRNEFKFICHREWKWWKREREMRNQFKAQSMNQQSETLYKIKSWGRTIISRQKDIKKTFCWWCIRMLFDSSLRHPCWDKNIRQCVCQNKRYTGITFRHKTVHGLEVYRVVTVGVLAVTAVVVVTEVITMRRTSSEVCVYVKTWSWIDKDCFCLRSVCV